MLVSVVIPTYNPGRYLDPGIESLLSQTLGADDYEIIVVDDGSTDGTPEHLDDLAARHPNLTVVHSEHSGWAGRPRNIGIDQARGEFIQFMDQDDRMAPNALRRLTDMARRNGSDIVLGKVASDFRGVALGLYRVNRDSCTIHDSQIISSLTPHKMFRRSFLAEHGIRFPEGRRRLEDQLFVVQAYFAARVISIVADENCYFYAGRDDGGNAGASSWEPAGYYANLREVLDVVVANTMPGPARDHLMRRFFRAQLVGWLTSPTFLDGTPEFRGAVFAHARDILVEYVDPAVDASLGAVMALRAELIRADRLDDLVTLLRRTSDVVAPSRIDSIRWVAGRLEVLSTTELTHRDGTPFVFVRDGGRTFLDPAFSRDLAAGPIDVTDELGAVAVSTTLRHRASGSEWATTSDVRLEWSEATPTTKDVITSRLRFRATTRVDPAFVAAGGRLSPGEWVWKARLNAFGFKVDGYVGAGTNEAATPRMPSPQFLQPDLLVTPRLAAGSGLILEVTTVIGRPRGQSIYRRPVWSNARPGTSIRRAARRIHGRLPSALRLGSASVFRHARSARRSRR